MFANFRKIAGYSTIVCLICAIFVAGVYAENLRETPVVTAVRKVGPAVVNISIDYEVTQSYGFGRGFGFNDPFFEDFFRDFFDPNFDNKRTYTYTNLGSGVIIDGDKGLILTNAHVLKAETRGANVEVGSEIKATLQDGREFTAKIVGSDPDYDLAVLQIESAEPLPDVPMGKSDDLMVGETVIAIGNPFGFANTVTTGVISSLNRNIRTQDKTFVNLIQLDASINPGNSGGPLLNIYGELIGINTAIYANAQGIGFAIPIDLAKKITADLIAHGKVTKSWIGLVVQPVDRELADYLKLKTGKALLVRMVEPQSPAARAGLKNGDVLISINGKNLGSIEEFGNFEKQARAGEEAVLEVLSGQQTATISLKIVALPESSLPALTKSLLGVEIAALPQNQGVSISAIDPNCYLARQGLKTGDVILGLNRTPTPTPEIFYDTLLRCRHDTGVTLTIVRGNRRYVVETPLGY